MVMVPAGLAEHCALSCRKNFNKWKARKASGTLSWEKTGVFPTKPAGRYCGAFRSGSRTPIWGRITKVSVWLCFELDTLLSEQMWNLHLLSFVFQKNLLIAIIDP